MGEFFNFVVGFCDRFFHGFRGRYALACLLTASSFLGLWGLTANNAKHGAPNHGWWLFVTPFTLLAAILVLTNRRRKQRPGREADEFPMEPRKPSLMRIFFHGWRWKLGCATLVMACVFMAGWVRSIQVIDFVECPLGNHIIFGMSSVDHAIACKFGYDDDDDDDQILWVTGGIESWNYRESNGEFRLRYPMFPGEGDCPNWYWSWFGFSIGESPWLYHSFCRQKFVIVPYWSIVLPLTLLSVLLMFSKLRVPAPDKTIDAPSKTSV